MKPKKIIILILLLSALGLIYFGLTRIDLPLESIKNVIESRPIAGPVIFIFATIVAIVVAPFSTFPLIPLAVFVFGTWASWLYLVIGWNIGGLMAFYLSRRYGRWLVGKMIDIRSVDKLISKYFSKDKKTFWRVLILRMMIPVDILSYALGITKVKTPTYLIATLIGLFPFSFVWVFAPGLLGDFINPLLLSFIFVAGIIILYFFWPTSRAANN